MEHVAIMKKSWGLTEKILSCQKTIESRWYKAKYRPWYGIKPGEKIYFKNSGEPVRIAAKTGRIIRFTGLTPKKVKSILNKYGRKDGIEKRQIPVFFKRFKDKKYGILIFLKNPAKVKSFDINKKGFGAMSAWITVANVDKIKK